MMDAYLFGLFIIVLSAFVPLAFAAAISLGMNDVLAPRMPPPPPHVKK